jgi:LAS superfamily LD-carboxypeptidase LdcB
MFLFSDLCLKKSTVLFLCGMLLSGHLPDKSNQTQYPKYLNKDYVLGKFDYRKDSGFVKVDTAFTTKEIYLRQETYEAFLQMQAKAAEEGIYFNIISGTRNFEHQKRIWEYKWDVKYKNLPPLVRAQKILEFSSMPSSSRHHWGTDLDLNSLRNDYFSTGKGKQEYDWLKKNAREFGFHQVYTSKDDGRTGYNEEKWHWSYLPLSSIYLKFYNQQIRYGDIQGFKGYELSKELQVIENYVNGIDPELL